MDHKVIIIGAGPAGLAMAGRLTRRGIPYLLLEQSSRIANSWERYYDRLKLHTAKQYSALPHKPFTNGYPTYIPKQQLLEYFHDYVKEFEIEPLLSTEVTTIRQGPNSWEVTASTRQFTAAHVVICTGLVRKPFIPEWRGLSSFKGKLIHSIDYKNPVQFLNKKVLVVGMGNSGAEIALDLALADINPSLSVRGEVNIVPRDFLGRPTQKTAQLLSIFPNWVGDHLGRLVQRLVIGDLSPFGLETPDIPPAKQLRETGKTPILDIGTIDQIKAGKIKVRKAIDSIEETLVTFENGESAEYDVIISATGFKPGIEDLISIPQILDDRQIPKFTSCPSPNSGLHFVGFDVYSLGIINSIYSQSEEVVNNIAS